MVTSSELKLGLDIAMLPRIQPKEYTLSLKTHKTTVIFTVPQATTIASVKDIAFSALNNSSTSSRATDDIPNISSTDDFELCHELKERGRPIGKYELLKVESTVRSALTPWETLYIRFKDASGELQPVQVSIPSLTGDEEEEQELPRPMIASGSGSSPVIQKRKDHPE